MMEGLLLLMLALVLCAYARLLWRDWKRHKHHEAQMDVFSRAYAHENGLVYIENWREKKGLGANIPEGGILPRKPEPPKPPPAP